MTRGRSPQEILSFRNPDEGTLRLASDAARTHVWANELSGLPMAPQSEKQTSTLSRWLRRLRRASRKLRWRVERRRLDNYRSHTLGRRAFLVGSGPSLEKLDLKMLDGEFVCVVNLGLRAVGTVIPHADMHVLNDVHCFDRYGEEIEDLVRRHNIKMRFLNQRLQAKWRRLDNRAARPVFVLVEESMVRLTGSIPPIEEGMARGATVLISAASLLKALGFAEVYVLGCDLDYDLPQKYAYTLSPQDEEHEQSPEIRHRRGDMIHVNQEFAVMRAAFEQDGKTILNAGYGGNLHSLERVAFESLFPGRPADSPR